MTMKIQFFWQKKQDHTQATISLSILPYSTQDLDIHQGDDGASQLPQAAGGRIRSGHCFELQTDDPVRRPLPSFRLLQLQWFLQRIAGMAGAADIDWPPYSDLDPYEDPYEEIPGLDLDEARSSSLASSDP